MTTKTINHEGWCVFNITDPHGVEYNLAFKDRTLRIRKLGWMPVEVEAIENTVNEVEIYSEGNYITKDLYPL